MPRTGTVNGENEKKDPKVLPLVKENKEKETANLHRMLGEVMKYISDENIVEIDIEYLLNQTEGLREWWNEFREQDRKRLEEEIKKSLQHLSLEELEKIQEQIKK